MNQLTEAQTKDLLKRLSAAFAVPVPNLRWAGRGGAHYERGSRTVVVNDQDDGYGTENATIHEFVHHLDCCKKQNSNHSLVFYQQLGQVVTWYYPKPSDYCWAKEWRGGQNYAIRRGWLAPGTGVARSYAQQEQNKARKVLASE